MSEQRLIELEIKAAYQDDLLQELNQVIIRQQQQIYKLEQTCRLLHERINNLYPAKTDAAAEPPPPHY